MRLYYPEEERGIGATMSVQSDQIIQDMSFPVETAEPPLTNSERAFRLVMVVGFFSILILEAWLLWQVWRLWA
jgi:hypothetical protein